MNNALASWVSKLDSYCLPAMAANIDRLKRLGSREDGDLGEMAAVIESDPALTLRLMRYINNLHHKHLRHEISSVRHGLMMLGMSHVQKIPENVDTVEAQPKAVQQRLLKHFSQALHAGEQVRDFARVLREMAADELYMAAVLHNLGAMLLDLHAPQDMARVHELMRAKQMKAVEAEYVVFGFTSDQLTIELALLWKLPAILLDSLRGENARHRRVLSVMLAAHLAEEAEHGWYHEDMLNLLEQLSDLLLSDVASVATLVHQNAVNSARESHRLGVWHPAAALLHPVPTQQDEPAVDSQHPEAPAAPAPESEEAAYFCLAPQRPVLDRVLNRLTNADNKDLLLRDVLMLTMEGMHDGLGLNRVMFAMLTPDKGQLRARRVIGSDNDPIFNRFTVDLNSPNLFLRLLEKPRALWLDDNNRSEFFPLVPLEVQKILRNDSFYAMSLFIKEKPVGIFYADRHTPACRLDAKSYKYFKHLVTQASMCLAQIQCRNGC